MSNIEQPIFIENLQFIESHSFNNPLNEVSERSPLDQREVWIDRSSIPLSPPAPAAFPGGAISGPVRGISGVLLTSLNGSSRRFKYQGAGTQQFTNIVPASYSNNAYTPTLRDSKGVLVPYNPSVWVADGLLSIVEFRAQTPVELGYLPPFTIDYWQYIGTLPSSSSNSNISNQIINSTDSIILNGNNNTITNSTSCIGGGESNQIAGNNSTIIGGNNNSIGANSFDSFIGSGANNIITDTLSFIGGGLANDVSSIKSSIVGGTDNRIFTGSIESSIVGGKSNKIFEINSFIGGGDSNIIQSGASFSSVVGGNSNSIACVKSFIGGGTSHQILENSDNSFIGGGLNNKIFKLASFASISGGSSNAIGQDVSGGVIGFSSAYNFIGGGTNNIAKRDFATVLGGLSNSALAVESTIICGNNNTISNNSNRSSILCGGNITANQSDTAYAARLTTLGGRQKKITKFTSTPSNSVGLDNHIVLFSNNTQSDMTLNFPTNPIDGQEYWIRVINLNSAINRLNFAPKLILLSSNDEVEAITLLVGSTTNYHIIYSSIENKWIQL